MTSALFWHEALKFRNDVSSCKLVFDERKLVANSANFFIAECSQFVKPVFLLGILLFAQAFKASLKVVKSHKRGITNG
eukprot:CAMPEP_0119382318 /NCGR_PEP_ID=MMETSP1334-20130426/71452_1 /TAXON_ID=127549 /ORGANISM="Calcidiscus leptoporus, Strain RCC1130" /LENGTH=77 /DNA_ID=CAMNT_0007402729 /DNA_START=178 /DNA_END=411 /DNA_ORIENTATION=+